MNNTIKVLHILGKRPVGGVGTFLKNMHNNLNVSEVQFDYLISSSIMDGDFDKEVRRRGGTVFVLPELTYSNSFKYIKQLSEFYKKNSRYYEIIHIHTPNIAVFNLILAKKNGIKNRIVHSHSTKYSDSISKSLRNFLLQLPIRKIANNYFACTEDSSKFLFGSDLTNNEVKIIKNAINLEDYKYDSSVRKEIRDELNLSDAFLIGHVGAFLPVKNHEFIINLFHQIHKKNNNTMLLLVGDGNLENQIKNKVSELGLEQKVIFMGRRMDVNKLMQAMDLFILPSLFEGMPLVGIEAQASGLPCVFSETLTSDIKVTKNVYFEKITDIKAWENKIISVSNQSINRELAYEELYETDYNVKKEVVKLEGYYKKMFKS